jgi:hypothetical protein
MSEMMAVALEYAQAGWPVIPLHTPTGNADRPCSCNKPGCESIGKHPRTMNGVKDATIDEAKIRRWWEQWPNANIGGALGPQAGRFAEDIDPRNGGDETQAGLVEKHGALPATLTAGTGGDGFHFIFKWPAGYTGKLKGALGGGVDVKGEGGYIVLAPSLHASGKRYHWLNDAPVVDAPQWMLNKLREPKAAAGPSGEMGEIVTQPGRFSALQSLAGTMRRRGMAADEIYAALSAVNERRCQPPLDDSKIRYIAESISKHAPAESQPEPELSLPYWMDVEPGERARANETKAEAPPKKEPPRLAISWGELCELKIERRETILHEVERGEIVMSPAITNKGKTTFWRNAALSAASGREFDPIIKAGPPRVVLYGDFETRLYRARADIMRMIGRLSQEERAIISQNFHLISDCRIEGRPLNLSDPKHLLLFEAEAARVKADLIIIDTLTAAFAIEDENSNAEAARVMKKLCGMALRLNCVVVFLHHIGKAKLEEGQVAQAVHRARGASAYAGFSHSIISLIPGFGDPNISVLECSKVKGEKFGDRQIKLDPQTRWFSTLGEAQKPPTVRQQVVGIFNGRPMKTSEVIDLLPGVQERRIKEALQEALKAGELTQPKRGFYQKPGTQGESAESADPIETALSALSSQTTEDEELRAEMLDWGEDEDWEVPHDDFDPRLEALDR